MQSIDVAAGPCRWTEGSIVARFPQSLGRRAQACRTKAWPTAEDRASYAAPALRAPSSARHPAFGTPPDAQRARRPRPPPLAPRVALASARALPRRRVLHSKRPRAPPGGSRRQASPLTRHARPRHQHGASREPTSRPPRSILGGPLSRAWPEEPARSPPRPGLRPRQLPQTRPPPFPTRNRPLRLRRHLRRLARHSAPAQSIVTHRGERHARLRRPRAHVAPTRGLAPPRPHHAIRATRTA